MKPTFFDHMKYRATPCILARICASIALLLLSIQTDAQVIRRVTFQFPLDGSRWVSTGAAIIIRAGGELDPAITRTASLVAVRGSASGEHGGRIVLADDRRTIIFTPRRPFAPEEKVTVSIGDGLRDAVGKRVEPWSFTFTTGRSDAVPSYERATEADAMRAAAASSTDEQGSAPPPAAERYAPTDFPRVTITASDDPSPGLLFLSNLVFNRAIDNTPYLMMVDNAGVAAYAGKLDGQALDFRRHPNGLVTYGDQERRKFYALDDRFAVVDSFACVGYETDLHDLVLMPNGHVLLMGIDFQTIDMSSVASGGRPDARVMGTVLQELDSSGNVLFQWRSFDHFRITDATHEDLAAALIDYVHPNSIELDTDGSIIMSSRHMDEVTKIDRSTGEIIWRLGGKNNQFTFIGDSLRFSHQHAARRIANGHLTMFDNGNFRAPQFSRALEYALDENAKSATLVWEYRHTPDIYGMAMGNVQRLDNGNTLISWGSANVAVTEVRPEGSTAFEMTLPRGVFSYRAFRFAGGESRAASLAAPADGAPGISTDPLLIWNPVPDGIDYRVQVATDSGFAQVARDTMLAARRNRFDDLDTNTTYYWRVMPRFAAGEGAWSDTWSFHTAITPVILVVPADRAREIPDSTLFGWRRVPGNPLYRLQISRDSTFATVEIADSLTLPFGWFGPLAPEALYYWRVRWENDSIVAPWSDVRSFATDAPLAAPHATDNGAGRGGVSIRSEERDGGGAITIRYLLPERGRVELGLFDERGSLAAMLHDGIAGEGEGAAYLDTRALPAGRYFCRLLTEKGMAVAPIIVLPR